MKSLVEEGKLKKFMMIMLVGIVCFFAAHGVALAANVKYVVIVDNQNYTIEEAEDKGELFRDDRGAPVTDLNVARRIAQVAYVKERILTRKLFALQQEIANIDTAIRMARRIAFLEAGRDLLARTFADCLVGGGIAGCVVPINAPIQVLADTVKDPKVYLGSAARAMAKNAQNRYQRIVTEAERFLPTHKPLDDKTAAAIYTDYVWAVREGYPSVVLLGDLSGLNERWYQDLLKMGKVASDEFLRLSIGSVGRIATADEIRRALQYGQRWLESLHPGQRFIRNLQGQARMADQITAQIDRHAMLAVRLATALLRAPQPQPLPVQPAPTAQQAQPGVPSSSLADAAQFVTDVTIPDGTMVNPGQSFTKTWRLRNSGTTTWGGGYHLVFVSGAPLGAPSTIAVPVTAPGTIADVSVPMVAPSGAGPYQGSWQLANAQGGRFGPPIWVKVAVSSAATTPPPIWTEVPPDAPPAPVSPPPTPASQSPPVTVLPATPTAKPQPPPAQPPVTISVQPAAIGTSVIRAPRPLSYYVQHYNFADVGAAGLMGDQGGASLEFFLRNVAPIIPAQFDPQLVAWWAYIEGILVSGPWNFSNCGDKDRNLNTDCQSYTSGGWQVGYGIQVCDAVGQCLGAPQTPRHLLQDAFQRTHPGETAEQVGNWVLQMAGQSIRFPAGLSIATIEATPHEITQGRRNRYWGSVLLRDPKISAYLLSPIITNWTCYGKRLGVTVSRPAWCGWYSNRRDEDSRKMSVLINTWSRLSGLPAPPPSATTTPPSPQPGPLPVPTVDAAQFMADVTVPDGTTLNPGQSFTKTWRLRNTGTTTWGSGYRLAFVSGASLSAPTSVAIPATPPGTTADVSVPMIAPSGTGSYQGSWQLTNAQGTPFGQPIWVKVAVSAPTSAPVPPSPTVRPAPPPPAPTPVISNLSPNPVLGSNTRQTLTLTGSGFAPGLTVTLRTGGQSYPIPPDRTTVVSPTQVQILADVTTTPATWSAQVTNPGGVGSNAFAFTVTAPPPSQLPSAPQPPQPGPAPTTSACPPFPAASGNPFEPLFRGYCTWYAADQWIRNGFSPLPSLRNATYWLDDARGKGFQTGLSPVERSLMVLGPTTNNHAGHVAYVKSVDPTGRTFIVSEMNWGQLVDLPNIKSVNFCKVTERTLTVGQVPGLLGFIYPPKVSTGQLPPLPAPSPSPPPTPVDAAQFVADVTIPDGTTLSPGQSFTKTWRLRNAGNSTWGSGYRLAFVGGTPLGAPSTITVPVTAPGTTADVSVPMIAPSGTGSYQGSWQLTNAQGTRFGQTIWVKITVSAPTVAPPPQATPPSPTPVISNLSPNPVQGSNTRQTLTLTGSGFAPGLTVTLRTGGQSYPIPPERTNVVSPTRVQILVDVTTVPASWTAQVTNPSGRTSNLFNFTVSAPAATPPPPVQPPQASPPPTLTDAAQFVADITIPDGTTLSPGQSFTKTWRLRNTGTTTWGSGYRLAFVGGAALGAPSTVAVPSTVPGNAVDVSVPMAAPSGAGLYQGSWQLTNAQGVRFGQTIWVKVAVSTPTAPPPPPTPANQAPTLLKTAATGASVMVGQGYSLSLTATDPDANLANIDVNWNDGSAVEHKLVSGTQASATFMRTFPTARTVTWSATAYDTKGAPSSMLSGSFTVMAAVSVPTAPTITGLSPNPVPGANARQTLTLFGSGFAPGLTVILRTGGQSYPIPPERTTVSPTQVQILVDVTTTPASWTAQVTNPGSVSSNLFSFNVIAPAPVASPVPPPPTSPGVPSSMTIPSAHSPGQVDYLIQLLLKGRGKLTQDWGHWRQETADRNTRENTTVCSGEGRHTGMDFGGGNKGASVYSATAGRVIDNNNYDVKTKTKPTHGWTGRVAIWNPQTRVTFYYVHMQHIFVEMGQEVQKDTLLGLVGEEGPYVDGAHLHFEARFDPNKQQIRSAECFASTIDPYNAVVVTRAQVAPTSAAPAPVASPTPPPPAPVAPPPPPINEVVGPPSLNFGGVQIGSCSAAYPFAIQNRVGAGTLTGSATASSSFRIISGSPFTLAAAQAQNIQVQFCPTVAGPISGMVTFATNGGTTLRSVSGQGISAAPTTGTVRIQATLEGSPWTGNVTTTLSGPGSVIVGSVPATLSDRPAGPYTLTYSSGGPSGARFPQISPSPTQSLSVGGTVTFTMNFTSPPAPPVSPSGLSTIVLSASQINLSWQDNGNNETGFRIERRPINGSYTQIAMVGINNTNYADTGLAAGTGYCYRVRAFNNAGDSGNSNEACGTTLIVAQLPGTWVGTWRSLNTGSGGSMTLTIAQGGGNSLSGSAVLSGHAAPSSFSLAGNTSDGLQFQLVNTPPPITAAITGTLTGGMLQGNYQTLQDRGTFSLRR